MSPVPLTSPNKQTSPTEIFLSFNRICNTSVINLWSNLFFLPHLKITYGIDSFCLCGTQMQGNWGYILPLDATFIYRKYHTYH